MLLCCLPDDITKVYIYFLIYKWYRIYFQRNITFISFLSEYWSIIAFSSMKRMIGCVLNWPSDQLTIPHRKRGPSIFETFRGFPLNIFSPRHKRRKSSKILRSCGQMVRWSVFSTPLLLTWTEFLIIYIIYIIYIIKFIF